MGVFLLTMIGWFEVFNATFNTISVILWWSVLLVEETGVLGENHRWILEGTVIIVWYFFPYYC
jgi:hypothetical protein